MAGDHRVPLAGHEHLEAAHVGLVDLTRGLVRHRLRLLVGALAEPDPAALMGEVGTVRLGAVVGLHHRSHGREVLPQLPQGLQRRVRGRVVLHVEGHRRAGVRRRLADLPGVLERDLVAVAGQRLPQRSFSEASAVPGGEAGIRERADERQCGGCAAPGSARSCPRRGSRWLTSGSARPAARGPHRVLGARTGHEAGTTLRLTGARSTASRTFVEAASRSMPLRSRSLGSTGAI